VLENATPEREVIVNGGDGRLFNADLEIATSVMLGLKLDYCPFLDNRGYACTI